jgi:hypothetical protein
MKKMGRPPKLFLFLFLFLFIFIFIFIPTVLLSLLRD